MTREKGDEEGGVDYWDGRLFKCFSSPMTSARGSRRSETKVQQLLDLAGFGGFSDRIAYELVGCIGEVGDGQEPPAWFDFALLFPTMARTSVFLRRDVRGGWPVSLAYAN